MVHTNAEESETLKIIYGKKKGKRFHISWSLPNKSKTLANLLK